MNTPRFMLDSSILINTLNNKLDLGSFIESQGECELFINLIVEIETLAKSGMTPDEEAVARGLLSRFTRVELDTSIRDEAIRIRRAKNLLLPDAGQFGIAELPRSFGFAKTPRHCSHGVSA